jgi:EAL domain-containing protein (putative c-di-GMP-specific phosphodiesterase class I)
VNISAVQLRSDGFVETVLETLQRTGLRPELLELEMTESMMLEGMDECRQRLTRLRAAGVRLALDDFGTGYSTLSYLPELPFDRLKIDRRFLARAYNGRGGEALIRAIISIGHTFGLAVVVEGIETAKDLDFVNSMNPDEIQGFLLGKPNPDPCAIIEHHFGYEKPEPGNDATSRDARLTQAGLNIAAV